jgi:opacity protein-like surface antigen
MENLLKIRPCPGAVSLFIPAVLLLVFALPVRSLAQAASTASRGAGLSVFAGYINSNPEYGPKRNNGEAFGANFIKYLPHAITPSIEGRYNRTTGTDVNENSFLGGIRIQYDGFSRYRFHPYGDFLMGTGSIHFNTSATGYTSDNSTVENFGGGVDVDLTHRFQLKADYQYQHWKLGQATDPFTPNLLLVGITYQFHFRDYVQQGDYKY